MWVGRKSAWGGGHRLGSGDAALGFDTFRAQKHKHKLALLFLQSIIDRIIIIDQRFSTSEL